MRTFEIYSLLALVLCLVLGVLILRINPARQANRFFFISSLALSSWLACFAALVIDSNTYYHLMLIRCATATAILIPLSFDMLRYAIVNDRIEARDFGRQMLPWIVILPVTVAVSLHPSFIVSVIYADNGFPMPVNGSIQPIYAALFALSLMLLVFRFWRDLRQTSGIRREELGYCVLAAAAMTFTGLIFAQLIPYALGYQHFEQLQPLCSLAYSGIVAYGIVTKRIMSVGEILRRAAAYTLVCLYLSLLYLVVFFPLRAVAVDLGGAQAWFPHLAATLVVAFSMAPANGVMQRVANSLFINLQTMDVRATVQQAQGVLTSIDTLSQILDRFARFLAHAAGTDHILILTLENESFGQRYPRTPDIPLCRIPAGSELVQLLRAESAPVATDILRRLRPTPARAAARRQLNDLGAVVAVGMQSKGVIEGLLLLGRRISGKIYGSSDLDALQIMGSQLGVAIENAKLYTAVQDGKIYNEILLDSLVSGVVAINAGREITVFNRQAQAILGLRPEQVIGQALDTLPPPIAESAEATLISGEIIHDRDLTLARSGHEPVPIRMSCATFHGHTGEKLGVLALLNDMTTLKRMEEQIRRSDRLSSLGTLAAGMAHEIKNPLVSIKTFTQLLPQQYEDEDFRRTFSSLVSREVGRIDTLVTRLLHFARPAKAALTPVHVHTIAEDALRLLDQQTRRHAIRLERQFRAESDLIMGDVDLLSQSFVNFLLNAIEAMPQGGTLTVATDLIEPASPVYLPSRDSSTKRQLRLTIRDTGVGIAPEHLTRIFDPFFTTKSNGTGLGLSVSHGIIQEHGATLEVSSTPGKGTTFAVQFSLTNNPTETP